MIHQNPSLAGRPPFATDQDEIYSTPQPHRRVRQQPTPNPNNRTSAYNMYDDYLNDSKRQSSAGAIGMGFMNGDLDSDDDDDDHPAVRHHNKHTAIAPPTYPNQSSVPLAAPRPGYAAPIAALHVPSPSPAQTPYSRQQPNIQMPQPTPPQVPAALFPATLRSGPRPTGGLQISVPTASPRGPPIFPQRQPSSPSPTVPSTPHPLDAPITPIQPAFLRPAKSSASRDIKFEKEPIMRGNSEDHLLPKRGEKGDEFWRRFSMVAKDDAMANHKPSSWLEKTEGGTNRLSRLVWVVGIVLLLCIGAGAGLGWYLTHNQPSNQQPKALGGSADEQAPVTASVSSSSSSVAAPASSSSPHVSPTNTVARRKALPEPSSVAIHMMHIPQQRSTFDSAILPSKHHNRRAHQY
jgi:hypothetical protein